MNQVIETIRTRRSVRDFDAREIPQDIIDQLIDAAHWSPSGMNVQPWRFVVVRDAAFRKKLAALALPRYQKWLASLPQSMQARRREVDDVVADPAYYGAPLIIFVVGKPAATTDFDCSMACQNIMLAARSLGIGSCWVYIGQLVLDDHEIRAALELDPGEKVYGPLVLGYPKNGFPEAPPRNKPAVKLI